MAELYALPVFPRDDQHAVFSQISAELQFFFQRERNDFRFAAFRQAEAKFVVIIYDAVTAFILVFKDPCLGCPIGLHGMMAVQMIRRQIEDRRNRRLEVADGLQLEAARFGHQPVVFISL